MSNKEVKALLDTAQPHTLAAPRPLFRQTSAAADFPVEVLPEVMADAIRAIHDIVQAPVAICGQSVMAVCTLAVQAHANVMLPTGQERPLNNFYFTIADSGERKSSSDKEAIVPIRKYEAELRRNYDKAHKQWKNAQEIWECERKRILSDRQLSAEAKRQALEALGNEPISPLKPFLLCPDNTVEGIGKYMAEEQPSVGWFSSEGGAFTGGYSMSRDHRLKTAALLSQLWDGEPITRIRAGEESACHPGKRLAKHMMMQPGVASSLFTDAQLEDQGLLSRILPAFPLNAAGTRLYRDPLPESRDHLNRYSGHLLNLLRRPARVSGKRKNELNPPALPLSDEARIAWIDFADHVERLLGKGGELEPVKSLGNKLAEHAARLAAMLTLVDNINADAIPLRWMEAGIALAKYYVHEALRILGRPNAGGDLDLAQRLVDWLHHSWSDTVVSLPDIYSRGLNAINTTQKARVLVAMLVEHGHLTMVEGGAIVKGVPRREVWRIVGKGVM